MSSLQGMTVAQLREEAERRGIEIGKGAKKAEIVAALENGAEAVRAEVIDDGGSLAVSALPGTISANFDALEAKVDGILAEYAGWSPSADPAEDVEQCAREREYLNGLAKEIDERRKAVKREFLKPLDAFEARANGIRDKIKQTVEKVQSVEKEADENRKAVKRAQLQEHYADYAGLLADVVPYEAIENPKWLNRNPSVEKCKEELEDRVDTVARDWETLKSMGLEGEVGAKAELRFFESLDLGDAVAWANKLAEDEKRLEAMKREMESYREAQREPEPEPAPAPAPQPAPVPEPMPAPQPAQYAPKDAEYGPCVMVIASASVDQMMEIGRFCGKLVPPVTGKFVRGTLARAYEKEMAVNGR